MKCDASEPKTVGQAAGCCACGRLISQAEPRGAGPKRKYCPECQVEQRRKHAQLRGRRYRERCGRAKVRKAGVATAMVLKRVAVLVGEKDRRRVHRVEQQALEKLRRHPEFAAVLRVWREWVAAGKPRPPQPHVGDVMLEHQERVANFYEIYERVAAVDAEAGQQILAEIDRYQQALVRGMEKLKRT